MLIFMLSPSLLRLPLEYYFPFQINRFTETKHRNKVISFRQNVSSGTFSHIENHSPNCTFSNNPFNLLTGISLPMDIVPQPRTTSKNKKTSRDKTFLTRYSNSLLKANIANINDISHYPSNIFSILGINVTSAGNQSTEPNCIDVSHLAASCSSK